MTVLERFKYAYFLSKFVTLLMPVLDSVKNVGKKDSYTVINKNKVINLNLEYITLCHML